MERQEQDMFAILEFHDWDVGYRTWNTFNHSRIGFHVQSIDQGTNMSMFGG